jgi:hypothetical protein
VIGVGMRADMRAGVSWRGAEMVASVQTRVVYQFPVSIPARHSPTRYCGSRVARAMMQPGAGISRIRQSALRPAARITTSSLFSGLRYCTLLRRVDSLDMPCRPLSALHQTSRTLVMLLVRVSSKLPPRIDAIHRHCARPQAPGL